MREKGSLKCKKWSIISGVLDPSLAPSGDFGFFLRRKEEVSSTSENYPSDIEKGLENIFFILRELTYRESFEIFERLYLRQ